MKKRIALALFSILFTACVTNKKIGKPTDNGSIPLVLVDTLLKDEINIRALLTEGNTIWYAADKGRFGFYDLEKKQKFENRISNNNLPLEFRSIAKTTNNIFVLSIGNPALLYKISKDGKKTELVYEEKNEKVFYDSMQFWNDLEGIAIGDPIQGCLSVIVTRDGGNSWQKSSCEKIPEGIAGEAAFAASNTNIVINGSKTWIVTGGKKARVFYSPDKAKSWQVFETPITQGSEMTGIFTAAFYNDTIGFIAGGNYEVQNQNFGNKATTKDGGKTWQLIAENQGFGYASCIQYIPGSMGEKILCVGGSGLQYSSDSGLTWTKLDANTQLYTLRILNETTAIAAGKNNILRIKFL